jgi:hypothetical protein
VLGPGGGCYTTSSDSVCVCSFSTLLDRIAPPVARKSMAVTSIRIPNEGADTDGPPASVAVFRDGGGLVTMERKDGAFRHLLLTQSAVMRSPIA